MNSAPQVPLAIPDGRAMFERTRRDCFTGMLMAGAMSLFLGMLQLVVPIFTMQVYDRVMNSRSTETLAMLLVIVGGGLIIYGLLGFLRARIGSILAYRLSHTLAAPALQSTITESLRNPGVSTGQAARDLNDLRLFVSGNAIQLPFDMMLAPFFLFVMFLLHPLYGALAGAGAVVIVGLGLLTQLLTRRKLTEANEASARSLTEIAGAARHAEVIEAMGMLPALLRRWQAGQESMLKQLLAGSDRAKAMASITRTVRVGLQVGIIALGALVVMDHEASPGSITASSIIMGRALLPFEQMIESWQQWLFAASAYRRIRRLVLETPARRQTIELPRPEGRILVDRLVFAPPGRDRAVIRGVTFQIEPGEAIGIIGSSGSGKSTLARLLVGLWEPTSGGIFLDDQNVAIWNRENFGRYVGYLPQSISILDGTVRENIARMDDGDAHAVIEAAKRADIHEMIGRLPHGYDTPIGEGGFLLSGGQRQRLALARALFGNPALLVLDEPNSNLDGIGEQALTAAITAAKAQGATVVVIAHRPSVLAMVDKILVLRDGMVERYGERTEILEQLARPTAPPAPGQTLPASARPRLARS